MDQRQRRSFSEFKPQRIVFALSTSWRIVLGVTALIDFCAAIHVFREENEVCPLSSNNTNGFFRANNNNNETCSSPTVTDSLLRTLKQLLNRWRIHIGVVFALLCFVDAVLKARWTRNRILIEVDRQRLLGRTDEKQERVLQLAWNAYMVTVGLHLLVVPVGVFVFSWHVLSGNHETVKQLLMNTTTDTENNAETEENTYSMDPRHGILLAMLHYYLHAIYWAIEAKIGALRKSIIPRLVRFFIKHPIRFSSRMRTYLRTLRLAKYLGPIFGACAKFMDNATELHKVFRQHFEAAMSRRRRKRKWQAMTPDQQMVAATVRVQSAFRGIQTRRSVLGFMTILKSRKTMVARRIQKVMRSSVVRAASRLDLKRLELEKLEEEARGAHFLGSQMRIADRRRMYQLQDELRETAYDLINKRLLLRPNTRFAVIWKVAFVLFVIMDIYQRAWPTQTAVIAMFLQDKLSPVTEWQECGMIDARTKGHFLLPVIGGLNKLFRRQLVSPSVLRWYCDEPFVSLQSQAVVVLLYLWSRREWTVGMVFYVDVVVTFFIGELHPKTGALVPKPFFTRWLFPGLLLELVVNPEMESTSRFLGRLVIDIFRVGPVRVWCWTVVLFYPLFRIAIRNLAVKVAAPAIEKENLQEMDRAAAAARSQRRLPALIQKVQSRTALGAARRRSVMSNYDLQSLYHHDSFNHQPPISFG